ncbi:MAG: hypothetical protein AAF355_02190 [Myxococcota bacterium]
MTHLGRSKLTLAFLIFTIACSDDSEEVAADSGSGAVDGGTQDVDAETQDGGTQSQDGAMQADGGVTLDAGDDAKTTLDAGSEPCSLVTTTLTSPGEITIESIDFTHNRVVLFNGIRMGQKSTEEVQLNSGWQLRVVDAEINLPDTTLSVSERITIHLTDKGQNTDSDFYYDSELSAFDLKLDIGEVIIYNDKQGTFTTPERLDAFVAWGGVYESPEPTYISVAVNASRWDSTDSFVATSAQTVGLVATGSTDRPAGFAATDNPRCLP